MISIKDWNSLTDSQHKKAVETVTIFEGGEFKDILPKLQGKYIASQARLSPYQKIMLSVVFKNKDGEYCVRLETKI